MKKILIFTLSLLFLSCASTKSVVEVPVKDKEIVEYRDTTIYLEKIVEVPVPIERVVEVVPKLDTLFMETSVAKSKAWVDTTNRVLRGRMENKQTALKGKIDTCFVVEYVDRIIEKEIAVEVPIEKPYIPKFAWLCIIFTCCWIVWKIGRLLLKIKGGI